MPVRKAIAEKDGVYFITFTCINWLPLFRISLVADFDPYQAGDLTADPDIKTQQFKHKNGWNILGMGWLANEDENGDVELPEPKGSSSDHSISSFFADISTPLLVSFPAMSLCIANMCAGKDIAAIGA